jgi:hypothetical protein
MLFAQERYNSVGIATRYGLVTHNPTLMSGTVNPHTDYSPGSMGFQALCPYAPHHSVRDAKYFGNFQVKKYDISENM